MEEKNYNSTGSTAKSSQSMRSLNKYLPKGFVCESVIGKGAFATIVKARHKKFGIKAFKISNEDIIDENSKTNQYFNREFERMTKIGNGLHPNIVRSFDLRKKGNRAVLSMDYVNGVTLNEYLKAHKFVEIDEVYNFINQIGGALAFCHEDIYKYLIDPNDDDIEIGDDNKYIISPQKIEGLIQKHAIIHNDLHSNNIMRKEDDGRFFLLDFGLSIQEDRGVMSNVYQGYPPYMSPEKLKMDPNISISTASDIYSFGVLMFEMLAGQLPYPYQEGEIINLYNSITTKQIPSIIILREMAYEKAYPDKIYKKDYPDWLENMVMKCLEKEPKDRYADAKEFMNEFNAKFNQEQEKIKNENLRLANENKELEQKLEASKKFIKKKEEEANWYLQNSKSIKTELTTYQNKANNLENENEALKSEIKRLKEERTPPENGNATIDIHPEDQIRQKVTESLKDLDEIRKKLNNITIFLLCSLLAVLLIIGIDNILLLSRGEMQIKILSVGLSIIQVASVVFFVTILHHLLYHKSACLIDGFDFYVPMLIFGLGLYLAMLIIELDSQKTLYISIMVLITLLFVLYKEQKWIEAHKNLLTNFDSFYYSNDEYKKRIKHNILVVDKLLFNDFLLVLFFIVSIILSCYILEINDILEIHKFFILNSPLVSSFFSLAVLLLVLGFLSIKLLIIGYICIAITYGIIWYLLGDANLGASLFELLIISALFLSLLIIKKFLNKK